MVDVTNQTTRFGFQKIGNAQTIEPALYNSMLDALDAQSSGTPHVAADFTLGAGVAFTYERPHGLRLLRLTLTNVVLTLAGATTSCVASESLLTWPATSNVAIASARMSLICVKDGVTLLSTDQPLVACGSAAAAVSTLATTAIDTVEAVTLAGTLSAVAQHNGPHTAGVRYVAKGASNQVFLNCGIASKTGGTLTVSGTVDIFYDDFGDFASLTT